MLAASAVAFTSFTLPPATTTTAATCKDVEFIFARGSGSDLQDEDAKKWRSSLESVLKNTSLTYDFYELGSKSYNGASYPAIKVGFDNLKNVATSVSSLFSVAKIGAFNASVDQGVTELVGRISSISSSCKSTKFVLGGYSQGAMVVTRAMSKLDADKIAYVATFGDPNLYLPEGYGISPDACRGKNLSEYRVYAPNCRAYIGLLGANKPYEPAGYSGKVGLWCTKKDVFCSNYFDFSDPIGDHLSYKTSGIYSAAAKTIVKKLGLNSTVKSRDTAILIDTTGSMGSTIEKYKTEALRLAKETLDSGGRVALFAYRDLDDPFTPQQLTDFGDSYDDFKTALGSVTIDGGGDEPESALSAALFAMNHLSWHTGATKSLIILTDAPYLTPDRDGTTPAQVKQRSLEIDPVNIYAIVPDELVAVYEPLTSATGGQAFSLDTATASTDYLLARPEVTLSLEEYSGRPSEEFTFTATSDTAITYDWDLDFDGEFEIIGCNDTVTTTYNSETSGFVQVRATDKNGLTSTASAKVTVTNSVESAPEITDLHLENNVVKFTTSKNTFATLVFADGAPLGITTANSFTLDQIGQDFTLTLAPVTSSGLRGDPKTLQIDTTKAKTTHILPPKSGIR